MSANILRKMSGSKTPIWLMKLIGTLWLPYLGAGIGVTEISDDYRYIKVVLKKRWYNSNYVGTQFGGSIYAMTDPFYMLMIMNNIGRSYVVWDKAAKIDFIKPGKSNLYAEFKIDEKILENIYHQTASGNKYVFDLPVEIYDENKELVATVEKTIYVRKKPTA